MGPSTPARTQQSYRHEALLWHDPAAFTEVLSDFVTDGLDNDEPIMAVLTPEHIGWLRDGLNGLADRVDFYDMTDLGRNPARIIPAWQHFLHDRVGSNRPARGIGEPVWPGRSPAELEECQLNEALLNLAITPETPFWLLCPYDAARLAPAIRAEAQRSYPGILDAGTYRGSPHYTGRALAEELFAASLAEPGERPREVSFDHCTVGRLPSYVTLELSVAGLPPDRARQLATAVARLADASLRRGASSGTLRIWNESDATICEIADSIPVPDPLYGRTSPTTEAHDALWEADHACDLVQLRSNSSGTTIRIHTTHSATPVSDQSS